MMKDLLKKVNLNRLIFTVFVVFIYIFCTDFIIHGVILSGAYKDSAPLWRPEQEMQSHMLWMLIGQFLVAKFFSILFARGYEGKGVIEGVRFGLLAAPLMVAPSFISYAVTPLPQSLFLAWLGFGYLQTVLAGVVAGLTYRR